MNKSQVNSKHKILNLLKIALIILIPAGVGIFIQNFCFTLASIIQRHEILDYRYGPFSIYFNWENTQIFSSGFFWLVYMYVAILLTVFSFPIIYFVYPKTYYQYVLIYISTCLIFFVLWIIIPTFSYVNNRKPEQAETSDHYCLYPSGHIQISLIPIFWMLHNFKKNKRWVVWFAIITPISILICVSTILTGQHYIFDIFFTIVILEIIFWSYYFIHKKYKLTFIDNLFAKINYIMCLDGVHTTYNKKRIFISYSIFVFCLIALIVWFCFSLSKV